MKLSVIVPTYHRPECLLRCLSALSAQERPADEVVVVVRETDSLTREALSGASLGRLPLRTAWVCLPGLAAALNCGLDAAAGDVVCFTDDDAAPHTDWLQKIEEWFSGDPKLGGLGGRDFVYHGGMLEDRPAADVGRLRWYGRVIGNHHLRTKGSREVEILKGVNMSFRRTALGQYRLPLPKLRGTGTQLHTEEFFCLQLKRSGWKLIYDPEVAVDHFAAPRPEEADERAEFRYCAHVDAIHNQTLAVLQHFPPIQKIIYLFGASLVGSSAAPGLLQLPRVMLFDRQALLKFRGTVRGRWSAFLTYRRSMPQRS